MCRAARYENVPDNWRVFSSSMRTEVEAEDTMAHFLGREAAEFINDHSDEPFVLYVSTVEPHSPYNGPYNDLYDPATLPTGPSFLKDARGRRAGKQAYSREQPAIP